MAAKSQPLIDTTAITTTPTVVFTADARTVIDAFVVNNPNATAKAFTASIVKAGGTASSSNQVVTGYSLGANVNAWPAGLNGQVLNPGDFISASGDGLNIRASGRVLTDA